jgi:hypothetical protein
VGVVIFSPTLVCLHPIEKEAIARNQTARLQRFIEYKSFIRLCDENTQFSSEWAEQITASFADRAVATECEGERDPRCLPLHVFKNSMQHALGTSDGRIRFDKAYGNGQERIDDEKRGWRLKPHEYHGQEELHVRGKQLRPGFHWDVQPGGDSTLVVTTAQVWKVKGYINVYPDSNLRVTGASKAVRVV